MQPVNGSKLRPEVQQQALCRFISRFTRENTPTWSYQKRENGKLYKVQFASDREWLENTEFEVNSRGELTARSACYSNPTWPEGPQ